MIRRGHVETSNTLIKAYRWSSNLLSLVKFT